MKKLLTLFAIALAVVVSSCSKFDDGAIWEKFDEQEQILNDHEMRIAALEELCRQLNTNIDALQTIVEALEKNDYVTNVSSVREDGEIVGYTISFANSDTITIYNGKDGVDGTDGKDGYTPQIGVMKDTDGTYYWTIDGEWLLDGKGNKIKAVGEDGRDGQDGTNGNDGQDGNNGQDGVDGIDGITPRLKIENDYWYVSYDEGATWIELGRATGEDGADGSDGSDGDSIFTSVTQDEEYVYFNLADGTMITLPKHDKENIQFEDLQVKAICCKNWDTNNDGELSYAEAAAVTDIGTVFKGNTKIIAFTELQYFTGVTTIVEYAFSNCTNLWKIEIPCNVLYLSSHCFNGCSSLVHITIPENLLSIGDNSFNGCSKLHNIKIPSSVTTIGYAAFYNCASLKSLIIPDSVTYLGAVCSGCSSLEYLYIPNSVSELSEGNFTGCTGELYCDCNIPDGTEKYISGRYYRDNVFDGAKFSKVIIGDNVTTIGDYAFWGIETLNDVEIGKNVSSLGRMAFSYGSSRDSARNIFIKAVVPPTVGYQSFGNVNSNDGFETIDNIYVPTESVDAYKMKWSNYSGKIVGYEFE